MKIWKVKKWEIKKRKANKSFKNDNGCLERILLMKYNSRLEHKQPFQFLWLYLVIYL